MQVTPAQLKNPRVGRSAPNQTSFAQESQKMYLEFRVASNPSVLGFGLLNQAPISAIPWPQVHWVSAPVVTEWH